jgi:hypothetical protein
MSTTEQAEAVEDEHEDSDASPPLIDRAPRAAVAVFAAAVVAAFGLYLWAGKDEWFYLDEWDFLAGRDGGDITDVLRSHNEHWTSLPILAYRLLFNAFGLRTYTPYLVLAIAVHLAAATVLRIVMRRAGVGPWIATAAAGLFVLFGSGDGNILRGFQVTFSGALLFGLIHIVLIDHDGSVDWRDWLGLLAGAAALMCSGLGVAMVAAVAVAALLRRGWRVAALHTVPLAVLYGTWWLFEGRDATSAVRWRWGDIASFVVTALDETGSTLTQVRMGAVLLAVLAAVGLALAWGHPSRAAVRHQMAAPLGLLVAAALFLLSTASGRVLFGSDFARASRYIHLVAALVLPALAVAAAAIARRWRVLGPVMVVLFVLPIPGNIAVALDNESREHVPKGDRDLMLAYAQVPVAADVPRWAVPDQVTAPQVTLGWLLDGIASGRIPRGGEVSASDQAAATVRLAIQQIVKDAPYVGCEPVTKPVIRHMEPGQSFGIRGGRIRLVNVIDGRNRGAAAQFEPTFGQTLQAVAGPLDVQISSDDESRPALVCG